MISEFLKSRAASFRYAFSGLYELWTKESNSWIHLFFTIAATAMGFLLKISGIEWCILLFAITNVWAAEAMNAALERNVDLATDEWKPLAKKAKDLAAGAVLIYAISSVIIGLIIFLPKLIAILMY